MPCVPRQLPLNSLDELLLIRGFTEQTLAVLRKYVTVIPRGASPASGSPAMVNAATADPLVLSALGCEDHEGLKPCVQTLGGANDEKTTAWTKEFTEWKTSCKLPAGIQLGTSSKFFAIEAIGNVGDVTQTLRTMVRRDGKKAIRLSWQERPVFELPPTEAR